MEGLYGIGLIRVSGFEGLMRRRLRWVEGAERGRTEGLKLMGVRWETWLEVGWQ